MESNVDNKAEKHTAIVQEPLDSEICDIVLNHESQNKLCNSYKEKCVLDFQ